MIYSRVRSCVAARALPRERRAELRVLILVMNDPKETAAIQTEMRDAGDLHSVELETVQQRNHVILERIERYFQLIMLLQSMLQSVIMLMIARYAARTHRTRNILDSSLDLPADCAPD